jgi:trimethylamine:corrinoid methyltransferase-like protein
MEMAMDTQTLEKTGRRSGGRASRVAARTAPLATNLRPVRAGMSGGQYSPLSEASVLRIHEAALDALETIGLSQAPPSGVEILTGAGAILGDDGRIRFPRALVEDMLTIAKKDVVLYGRDPAHDLDPRQCAFLSARMVARDVVDNYEMDINTTLCLLRRHDQTCRHQSFSDPRMWRAAWSCCT